MVMLDNATAMRVLNSVDGDGSGDDDDDSEVEYASTTTESRQFPHI